MNVIRRSSLFLSALVLAGGLVVERSALADETNAERQAETSSWGFLPNNLPIRNEHGHAATYSSQGEVNLQGAFFTPQGSNGRHCGSCHAPEAGWSMSAALLQQAFDESQGLAPVFNALDADRNGADPVATVEQRRQAYSMLLQGKFSRNQTPPANAEFSVVAANDPFGIGSTTRFWFFRRALPTANFRSHIVSWDGANTVGTSLHEGLARQARGNITGAQQGTPPANETIVQEIVEYEKALSHAQLIIRGVGRLDVGGAHGGPEYLSEQPLVAGRFDLFDAWIGSHNPRRAQIARGQEIFNDPRPNGGSCRGCHNAANDGQNVAGIFFDIGASRPEFALADMAIYTLQNKTTGEVRQTTDGGRGWRSGRWADLDRFKSPSLRGVSSRGEYFHNGIAKSLEQVVTFYETSLGFAFSAAERADLVAFLKAL